MSRYEALKALGAEIKTDKNNQLIIGFTSQSISNEQLNLLVDVDDDSLFAFYSCDFSKCNLELLERSKCKKIAIIYCQFNDRDLYSLCKIKSLNWLKLFDTKVSSHAVDKVLSKESKLIIIYN